MFFLNLSAFEFIALLGTIGSLITALYLLDRRRRSRVVSTLQFWTSASNAEQSHSRRHMQQPWSLLLQLLSLILLLLAAAQVQWGKRPARARDYVVVLDTSTWAGARDTQGGFVLNDEKRLARAFLKTLPAADRALILYADALASPATTFTSDRSKWEAALTGAKSGASALNLDLAIDFARNAGRWSTGTPAEIVYIGPGIASRGLTVLPPNLRVIRTAALRENIGIDSAVVQQSEKVADEWRASFTLRNDGQLSQTVQLLTAFAGTSFSPRTYQLRPGGRIVSDYRFTTGKDGLLKAQIRNGGALESDDRVQIQLPGGSRFHVVAVTSRRDRLAPLLSAMDAFAVEYVGPEQYRPGIPADLLVFDEFAPAKLPATPCLWLHPPRNSSPLPVGRIARNALLSTWNTMLFGDTGLRTKDLRLAQAEVFQTSADDTAIASVTDGPVVVARNSSQKSATRFVVVGFDLLSDSPRTDLTTPLLVASALNWLAPQVFRPKEFLARKVGALSLPIGDVADFQSLQVTDETGAPIPYSVTNGNLQLFVAQPRIVHLSTNSYQRSASLTLPDVPTETWAPPSSAILGLPAGSPVIPAPFDLWKWLAVTGGLCLLLEWIFFGRKRKRLVRRSAAGSPVGHIDNATLSRKVKEGVSA